MAANLKSHVLRRDEKGLGGISFARLLFGFMAGGSVYALGKGLLGDGGSILGGIVVMIAYIFLTGRKGGIPRHRRIMYGVRGSMMLSAFHGGGGLIGRVCQVLELDYEHMVVLDGDRIFKSKKILSEDEGSLIDWEFLDQPGNVGMGTRSVPTPVIVVQRADKQQFVKGDGRLTSGNGEAKMIAPELEAVKS